jgi:hypothetical protein
VSRHHRRYAAKSAGAGATPGPYAVSSRNRTYARSGIGTNGGRRHHPDGDIRNHMRSAVGHNDGDTITVTTEPTTEAAHARVDVNRGNVVDV